MFKIMLFTIVISTSQAYAMYSGEMAEIGIFKQGKPIKLSIEETIPDSPNREKAINLLKSTRLELVKTNESSSSQSASKADVGYNFPNLAPWDLLITKFIKDKYESSNLRPNLGDWGCGHGIFSRHAVISGANPYVIELHKAAAEEANKNIFGAKGYLPDGVDIKNLYKAFHGSVTCPQKNFMDRKNAINVSFNVLHHLNPSDGDLLLKNMFENTVSGGITVVVCDTPFGSPVAADYYNQSLSMKLKYPGFGVYNSSKIAFKDNLDKKYTALQSIHRPSNEEIQTLKTGQAHNGTYPKNQHLDDTKTIFVDDLSGKADGNILGELQPYYYQNYHALINKFDYLGLKEIVEAAGFKAVNGWYTDHTIDTLYPYDVETDPKLCRKSKVVLVAQKE